MRSTSFRRDRKPADAIRRILLAWRDTRETARAVAEALPFIEKATRTAVVLVDAETGAADEKRAPEMDIARHLDRHGTNIEVHMVESGDSAVSEVILEQARRVAADLVVMGGYGHSRAREMDARRHAGSAGGNREFTQVPDGPLKSEAHKQVLFLRRRRDPSAGILPKPYRR